MSKSLIINKKKSDQADFIFSKWRERRGCLGLLAVRKLSFVLFLLREITTHYSFLTWTAFRSLSFTSALPKSAELAKAILTTINSAIKKRVLADSLFNGGNDEARTRDLMRDRHAL